MLHCMLFVVYSAHFSAVFMAVVLYLCTLVRYLCTLERYLCVDC